MQRRIARWASPAVVLGLAAREPDRWPGKARLIGHARELALTVPALEGVECTFDTAGRDAEVLARELLAAMRAKGLAPSARSA